MSNAYGKDHEEVQFMVDAFNREVQGLDDIGAVDPHVLGESEHAARNGGYELCEFNRDLPGALPRRCMDAGDEGPERERH
jgi:hypothetical protein